VAGISKLHGSDQPHAGVVSRRGLAGARRTRSGAATGGVTTTSGSGAATTGVTTTAGAGAGAGLGSAAGGPPSNQNGGTGQLAAIAGRPSGSGLDA